MSVTFRVVPDERVPDKYQMQVLRKGKWITLYREPLSSDAMDRNVMAMKRHGAEVIDERIKA